MILDSVWAPALPTIGGDTERRLALAASARLLSEVCHSADINSVSVLSPHLMCRPLSSCRGWFCPLILISRAKNFRQILLSDNSVNAFQSLGLGPPIKLLKLQEAECAECFSVSTLDSFGLTDQLL